MSVRILKREEVVQKLKDWQANRTSSEDLLHWADSLYPSDDVDYEDWEGDDSVTCEVMAALDLLDVNLSTSEDAPIYIEFLSTPIGHFQIGYAKYKYALDQIDHDARRAQLSDVPLYWPFLRNQKQPGA